MGTRRGNDRRAESDAFEAANPFLTRVDTKLEVERVEEEPPQQGDEIIQLLDEDEDLGILIPKVTQDGQPVAFNTEGFMPVEEGFSVVYGIETPVGALFAWDGLEAGPGFLGDSAIVLSDYGFGVATEEDVDDQSLFSLDGDEKLIFFLGDGDEGEEGFFFDPVFGGAEFDVGFMVMSGSGQVEIDLLIDEDEEGPGNAEAMSGFLTAGDTGSFDANALGDDLFGAALIGVTGSLEVVITGITVTTNYEGSLVDFGDIFGST